MRVLIVLSTIGLVAYFSPSVGEAGCPCQKAAVFLDWNCYAQWQCTDYVAGAPIVTNIGPDSRSLQGSNDCNNCDSANPMYCLKQIGWSYSETGSVTYGGSYSQALKAEINNALAGSVGITTTTQFSAGATNTTTWTFSDTVTCGSTAIAPFSWTLYEVYTILTPKSAQIPIGGRWYVSAVCNGTPGPWYPNADCGAQANSTIQAQSGSVSGCEAHDMHCFDP